MKLDSSWSKGLGLGTKHFARLVNFLDQEDREHNVYPARDKVFAAFDLCAFEDVKVVVVGQDPYHGSGQAMGLSFSVPAGEKIPPSLRNIYKELETDLGFSQAASGDLTAWAEQGVFLLNTCLTVRESEPASHAKKGWEEFTSLVLEKLSKEREGLVFVLWGAHAQKLKPLLDEKNHFVIESAHPSPLSASRGFFGSKPFSKANDYLMRTGKKAIDWQLEQFLF